MKNNDNNHFWHHMPAPEKKPSLIKKVLIISSYVIGFLIISFLLIGIYSQPAQTIDSKIKSSPSISCKYSENNTKNILALINEYRVNQKLPAFTEYSSLNQYQEAVLTELQKNGEIKNNELLNIVAWQKKYTNKDPIVYLGGLKVFGVSSFSNPCFALDFLKNNNNSELLSTNYDSLGIAMVGKDAMIILGKKTEKPSQNAVADQNILMSGYKLAQGSSYAPYSAPTTSYANSTSPTTTSTPATKGKSPEESQSCINYYQSQLDNLKTNYDLDLQSESSRYSQERDQISRDMASRGLTGSGIASQAFKEASTYHQNITNSLKTNYDIQVDSIKSRQQSC